MEELLYIKNELNKIHEEYIEKMKDIWTNNEPLQAEKLAKKEFTKWKGKEKVLELAYSQIKSGLDYLNDYKKDI